MKSGGPHPRGERRRGTRGMESRMRETLFGPGTDSGPIVLIPERGGSLLGCERWEIPQP